MPKPSGSRKAPKSTNANAAGETRFKKRFMSKNFLSCEFAIRELRTFPFRAYSLLSSPTTSSDVSQSESGVTILFPVA